MAIGGLYNMINKKTLILLVIPSILFGVISCRPTSRGDDHKHTPATTWSYDRDYHWHACTGCDEKLDKAIHTFNDGEIIVPPTETTSGTKRYTCSICSYYYDETIEPDIPDPGEDILTKMNNAIKDKSFIDPYEVRDYLLSEGYDEFISVNSDGNRYGYSEEHSLVVEYKDNNVLKPTECIGDRFVNYQSINVSTFNELVNVFNSMNEGLQNYYTINLEADIYQTSITSLAQFTSSHDIEINLNNHTIHADEVVDNDSSTTKWYTLQFMDKNDSSRIYIHNGTIEANRKIKPDGIEDDSCCLSLASAKSFRLDNLSLIAKNGSQCIGDLSQYLANHNNSNKKVYISNVTMDAPLRAITIAGGTWDIRNCNDIKGMVCIDGGNVVIDNCVINAETKYIEGLNDYEQGFTNHQLESQIVATLNGSNYNDTVISILKRYYGAVTFNDAICILSRRFSSYAPAKVEIKNSTLTPVKVNDNWTGYGIRYWDVEGYDSPSAILPISTNNTFVTETGFGNQNF